MTEIFLTPEALVRPACRPETGEPVGVAIVFRREGGLAVAGMGPDGGVYETAAPPGWADRLLLFRFPARRARPVPRAPADRGAWFELLWPAERACLGVLGGDWAEAGAGADAAWRVERLALPADPARDALYAGLRLAGAWGGRFRGRGLSLWAPPAAHAALTDLARKEGGERVATGHPG